MDENETFVEGVCCFFNCGFKTILAKKTRKIGAGLWNGYGGKKEGDETPEETCIRELYTEAGVWIIPKHLKKVGEIYFHNMKNGRTVFTFKVHIFFVIQWGGEVTESEEMATPTEFLKDNLPYDEMMPADAEWLPFIMRGEKIVAHVFQDIENNIKTGATIVETVESFEKAC
ncbi:hypothetical protein A2996_00560 [Candidatus Campbellbacteria bacterium RIFCSPLOWO2_01_FULL_34_15]|uniref:Oxidized purine nucleoside triphosphate hydrolase n=2 Tax=Candidatus Campbelliibacteriota TaxID=1752727 RepID=A0A1F5EL85_9BACT|nr:MAG: hypothetical protein A2996_00560 [Candidatus Campbellbacteria bacterium RIFCSPLOWO2_01_FULL_34_15]OGD68383.1 MAG: hypothetical protein A2811_01560 [Candidatus Campbellbacteria bacterium RIFCSPHIGHO2_01_FULL_34_10]